MGILAPLGLYSGATILCSGKMGQTSWMGQRAVSIATLSPPGVLNIRPYRHLVWYWGGDDVTPIHWAPGWGAIWRQDTGNQKIAQSEQDVSPFCKESDMTYSWKRQFGLFLHDLFARLATCSAVQTPNKHRDSVPGGCRGSHQRAVYHHLRPLGGGRKSAVPHIQ